ncbi:hypothetical protein HK105_205310 [Polyrhizophydium stewartii]|uniref:Uncharacterized protein n=1 Tax=Polyrhizophydium stewartii TaxID=2732419 RepID=A0ABR4N6P9_9FUNG
MLAAVLLPLLLPLLPRLVGLDAPAGLAAAATGHKLLAPLPPPPPQLKPALGTGLGFGSDGGSDGGSDSEGRGPVVSVGFRVPLNASTFVEYRCSVGPCFRESLVCTSPAINGTTPASWSDFPDIQEPHFRPCALDMADTSLEAWRFVRFEILNLVGLVASGSVVFLRRRRQHIAQYRRLAGRAGGGMA